MNAHLAAGSNGMNRKIFQSYWHIIGQDLLQVVLSVFCGKVVPKYFSNTCLVLLPKVEHPNKLLELRPISLINFTKKVISKLLYLRVDPILSSIISSNQLGFMIGRNIIENIMLAQEITSSIKKTCYW